MTVPRWIAGLPFWAFMAVYAVTCVIAAIPMALGYRPLHVLVKYFAGVTLPQPFDTPSVLVFWSLLFVAPALMGAGYWLAWRALARRGDAVAWERSTARPWPAVVLFALLVWVAVQGLLRAGVIDDLGHWWDYGRWVESRWKLFKALGYFEFVNLYVWIPVIATWLLLRLGEQGGAWRWIAWGAVGLALATTLALYQKKSLLAVMLLLLFAQSIATVLRGRWRSGADRAVMMVLATMVAMYLAMTVLPVWRETTSKLAEIETPVEEKESKRTELVDELSSILGSQRTMHVAAYVLLSPFTRTSLPSFYYSTVFPGHHPYFGMDWGFDILGFGNMPNDNYVVWNVMYPRMPGGSVSAPFQFILFSQVGLVGALLASFVAGALLAAMWRLVLQARVDGALRAIAGALIVLFSVYIAIDSPRNSLVASYGLMWGALVVLFIWSVERLVARWHPPTGATAREAR